MKTWSKGEKNFIASYRRKHKETKSDFDLSLPQIHAENDRIKKDLWQQEQNENSKKALHQYSQDVAASRITSRITAQQPLFHNRNSLATPTNVKPSLNTDSITPKNNNLFFDYNFTDDDDCLTMTLSQKESEESSQESTVFISEQNSPSNHIQRSGEQVSLISEDKFVEAGLSYYGMCEKSYADVVAEITKILSNCQESNGVDLEKNIKHTFDQMFTQCFYFSLKSCIFTINKTVKMTSIDQLTSKALKNQYKAFLKYLERKARSRVAEVRNAFSYVLNELHPTSCDDDPEVLTCTEQHELVYESLHKFVHEKRLSVEQIETMASASQQSVRIYNTNNKDYLRLRNATEKVVSSVQSTFLPPEVTVMVDSSVTSEAISTNNITIVPDSSITSEAISTNNISIVPDSSITSNAMSTNNISIVPPRQSSRLHSSSVEKPIVAIETPTVGDMSAKRPLSRRSVTQKKKARTTKMTEEKVNVTLLPTIFGDTDDEEELQLMESMAENLNDSMYFARHYSATEDFKNNDKPFDVLNSGWKHYVYPLVLCSPPPEGGFPVGIDKIKDSDYVKQSPMCRYLNKLCTGIATQLVNKASFVSVNGTVFDQNEVFSNIVNNDGEIDDGKRQSTYINLRDPSMTRLRNVVENLKNLIKFTGAVPVNCFPTSGNNMEDHLTFILQLCGAGVQHFHFDFKWSDFLPQRTGNVADIGRYSKFHGCAMFFNFSFIEQTIDLQAHDVISNCNQQLYNPAISLMLMRGDQCHAGSANTGDFDVAKMFMYIRKPQNDEKDVYFIPSNGDFDTATAIEMLSGVCQNNRDRGQEEEVLLFYGPSCCRYADVDAFGV